MPEKLPEGKWQRSVVTGKTAAMVGGKVLRYLSKKPFLSEGEQKVEKKKLEEASAKTIFKGLVLLKGTALKIAQALSLESGIIPDEIRAELEKSYNQVPPMNRVLVRKVLKIAFHQEPDKVFKMFDMVAVAAASLGQVHKAVGQNGEVLAVKVQYPGISETIKSDIQMMKALMRPLPEYQLVLPSLLEIEKRLKEEVDYSIEAGNINLFRDFLMDSDICVPSVYPDYSSTTVLATQFVEGKTIDAWLKDGRSQNERDHLANTLYQLFIDGFYKHRCIHADPNPGNYIITDENKLCLVDFGCVKHFSKTFIADHQQLIKTILEKNSQNYIPILQKLNVITSELSEPDRIALSPLIAEVMSWYRQLYQGTYFDFNKNGDFLKSGRELMSDLFSYRKNFAPNAEFVFLDRTRYGLFRLFESMVANVKMNNRYESGG